MTVPDWQERTRILCEQLSAAGKLTSPEVRAAVEAVPRHEFVPDFYEREPGQRWRLRSSSGLHLERWLELVYANTSLVTEIGLVKNGGRDTSGATSSASAPSLVTRMLDALDLHDGNRVLEIGTGTGWNAGLLTHMLGDEHVFSMDVDGRLVLHAQETLHRLGYHPSLITGDGFHGWPEKAPYDRIIATCAVSWVPWSWAQQITTDGLVLADVKVHAAAGNLVLLHRRGGHLEGRFDPGHATFMHMRTDDFTSRWTPSPPRNLDSASKRAVQASLERPWEEPVLWFLVHLTSSGRVSFGYSMDEHTGEPGNVFFHSPDGSWCEVSPAGGEERTAWEGGPTQLWATIEAAAELWHRAGTPGWDRFGLTVTENGNTVWLDDPVSANRWKISYA